MRTSRVYISSRLLRDLGMYDLQDSDRRISEHVLRMHCSRRTLPSCIP